MAQLLAMLDSARDLSESLKDHAEDPAFGDLERKAFKADMLWVASTTQELSTKPAFGFDSPQYDGAAKLIAAATVTSDAAISGDPLSIHRSHLDVVAAVAAMQAVTAAEG